MDTHIFDGKSLSLDGKVWQVCDITDPTIISLAKTKHLREVCDPEIDGWYCNGTWAKIKTVMRAKITAIRAGVEVPESAFKSTLEVPDEVEIAGSVKGKKLNIPQPDLRKWGVEGDNPNREGVKRKRLRIASRRWGAKDGRKIAKKGKKAAKDDFVASDEEEEDAMDLDDDDDEDADEVTTSSKNYVAPKLRARSSRAAASKGKEKSLTNPYGDLGDIFGDEDVDVDGGEADGIGPDEDDDAAGMGGSRRGSAKPVAEEDEDVSEYEAEE